ncbi:FAS-associated factor 1 [Armadillidium nasatum]|uniref:FAS-associated factor 1 n=1 Tax=Armadillidium nasatum TaxID=96803 RepID=A0A5N5T9B6_9CRUS|nr:FAS-associated factor 1 [Armadillidium nasatum]
MSGYDGKRDEILLNFQAITGIDKVEDAFGYLESCNWNLEEAVNKVIPEPIGEGSSSFMNDHESPSSLFSHAYSAFSEVRPVDKDSPVEERPYNVDITGKMPLFNSKMSGTENSFSSTPSTSKQDKVLDINIKIKYEGDDSEKCPFPFEIPQSTTVEELKTLLHHLLGIPPCHQVLEGFAGNVLPSTVITRDLLPGNLSLTLTTSPEVSGFIRRKSKMEEEEEDENYELQIRVEENDKSFDLRFPPSKIVKDIKSDLYDLSGIPVRHQLWIGWPSQTTDSSTLRSLGLPKVNKFILRHQVQERTPKLQHKVLKITEDASEDNSSADEFEDASELLPEEDYLVMDDVPTSQSSKSLIPPDIEGEENAAQHFVHEFQNRYGSYTPLFFQGTLQSALKESVMLPARTRKPLAIYIHHDKSVSANVFCSQALCQQSVVDYLSTNFVIWGWDITHESNKNTLLKIISTNLGSLAANTVRGYSVDKLPALLIINRSRGSSEILTVIHAEQDAAYHASLEADRAKEQARKLAEYEQKIERQRQQSIKEQEDALKRGIITKYRFKTFHAVRASLESGLPPEPDASCNEPTTVLRFRVPKGDMFSRCFTQNTKLQVVLDYLFVQGYPPNEYKYLQSWPRRCIANLDTSKTLADHGFPPQELITLEERPDADMD